MTQTKKKKLPKDFSDILERGDAQQIFAVFDECDVNATGGYGNRTAAAFATCPDNLLHWLVENGADLTLTDDWGNTVLHERAGSRRGSIEALVELIPDPNPRNDRGNTPLHSAAMAFSARNAALLVKHGALVDAKNRDDKSPLEAALATCRNIDIPALVELAETLIASGAALNERMAQFVTSIGKAFEFGREGFNKDRVDDVSSALSRLYVLFEVEPVPRLQKHDGKTPIVAVASTWQDQHSELWDLLVPATGYANTVQGELIRISGRLRHEIDGNGGANWDADFGKMATAFVKLLQCGNTLSSDAIKEARALVKGLGQGAGRTDRLAQMAVDWVRLNPAPVLMSRPAYKR